MGQPADPQTTPIEFKVKHPGGISNSIPEEFMRLLGVRVIGKPLNRNLNDPHQMSSLPCLQLHPNVKVVMCRGKLWFSVRPRVFRIRAVICEVGSNAFKGICDQLDGADPVLKVVESTESEQSCDSVSVSRPDLAKESQELHETRMTFRWGKSRPPKVRFSDFLRSHLQILKGMTLGEALISHLLKCRMVTCSLFPPEFLVTVHFLYSIALSSDQP